MRLTFHFINIIGITRVLCWLNPTKLLTFGSMFATLPGKNHGSDLQDLSWNEHH